ncbi:MAG: hypothetical protein KAH54_00885 [Candidatus Sabulitectum sp.]|nr:hypothetical protein [Candidatus Sabulitectum sp.]
MKNLVFSFLSVMLFLPLVALGYGYPAAMGLGSIMPGIDAVSHGFGGVSSVNVGGMNLFGNPAELTGYNPSFSASIGPLILKQTVDDGLGKHTLTYAGLGVSSFQAGFGIGSSSVALGIAKIRDYTYKGEYFFIDTNPDPIIAGFENLTVTGGVWEAATGAATVLPGDISIGVSAGYRMGNIDYDYYWHHFNEAIPDSTVKWSREEGEFSWRAGASVPVRYDIALGAVYSSETENCPSSIAAGVRFGNIAAYSPGFGFEGRLYDTEDSKAWSANAFGGIHPDHNLYFRGGASLSSSGGNDAEVSLGISMGVTVDLGRTDISAAFNYGDETRNEYVLGFPDAKTINDIITAFTVGAVIEL